MPTTGVGLFRDFLPAPQICKSIFQSVPRFFSCKGPASLTSVPFHTLFHPTRKHLLRGFHCFHVRAFTFPSSRCCRGQSQPSNPFQYSPEQLSRDRHLRHLEDDLSGMAHNLRPDLDQFLPQRRQRPVTHQPGQHCLPQKVAQVVGQHEQGSNVVYLIERYNDSPGTIFMEKYL